MILLEEKKKVLAVSMIFFDEVFERRFEGVMRYNLILDDTKEEYFREEECQDAKKIFF